MLLPRLFSFTSKVKIDQLLCRGRLHLSAKQMDVLSHNSKFRSSKVHLKFQSSCLKFYSEQPPFWLSFRTLACLLSVHTWALTVLRSTEPNYLWFDRLSVKKVALVSLALHSLLRYLTFKNQTKFWLCSPEVSTGFVFKVAVTNLCRVLSAQSLCQPINRVLSLLLCLLCVLEMC